MAQILSELREGHKYADDTIHRVQFIPAVSDVLLLELYRLVR